MTFGYKTRSSRGSFRSPRNRGGTRGFSGGRSNSFRGRGRGSDSYFTSNRGSYHDKSPYRGGSYKGSNYHEREDFYEPRSSGSRYSHERYQSSHVKKEEESYHHRDIRESASGSFVREYPRRNELEPERKRIKSEIIGYKEGASPRRSYENLEHSGRSFNTSSSSYHSESSPFKMHKREYAEFKKPLPMEREYGSRRPSRGSRARGAISRTITKTIRPPVTSSMKRIGTSRVSKISSTVRLQQVLRRKKQLRIMRMRKIREEKKRKETKHPNENETRLSENDIGSTLVIKREVQQEPKPAAVEPKKVVKEIKKEVKTEPEENKTTEPSKSKKEKPPSPKKSRHITLRCIHCQTEYKTFSIYHKHLQTFKHKKAMEQLLSQLKQKLSQMRTEQRKQQRTVDEQCEDFAKTSYCKLCKLNFKQSKQEHYTSDFHVNMSEFLNPKCSVCHIKFQTPILYEHHRSTLMHIKRKAFVDNKKATPKPAKEPEFEDENDDEEGFMVLDSVGSADESNDENEGTVSGEAKETNSVETKKKTPKVLGQEYIEEVSCYYCKLCRMCLGYNPNKSQDETLLSHCRSRYHLKRYSSDKFRKKNENDSKNDSTKMNDFEVEQNDSDFWADENNEDNHKLSEDEEDSKSSIRYDRFGHSEGKDNNETEGADLTKNRDKSEVAKE